MYTVLSDNFVIGKRGDTLSAEQLEGCDIDALLQGGHLAPVEEKPDTKTTAKSATKEKE